MSYAKLQLIALILLACTMSCSNNNPTLNPFEQLYKIDEKYTVSDRSFIPDEKFLTFSANKIPLSSFARVLSDFFEIGVVFSEDLSHKEITAEIKHTDLKSVLGIISRQIQVDVINIGNTYYIGNLRPSDRGLFVRKMFGFSSADLTSIITPLISQQGKNFVTSNQIVVVADHEAVLKKCAELCDYLHAIDFNTYILQLYFVSLRKNSMIDGGLSTKSSGKISYDLQNNKIDVDDLKLESLFTFNASNAYADVYASPMMIIRDGSSGTWKDGENIPIAKKVVSDAGTVSTQGYEYIDVGFSVNAKISRTKNHKANLILSTNISELKEIVEGAPSTIATSFKIDVDLDANKLYLLGELSSIKDINRYSQLLNIDYKASKSTIQVWGKVYSVSGGVLKTYPVYKKDDKDTVKSEKNFSDTSIKKRKVPYEFKK